MTFGYFLYFQVIFPHNPKCKRCLRINKKTKYGSICIIFTNMLISIKRTADKKDERFRMVRFSHLLLDVETIWRGYCRVLHRSMLIKVVVVSQMQFSNLTIGSGKAQRRCKQFARVKKRSHLTSAPCVFEETEARWRGPRWSRTWLLREDTLLLITREVLRKEESLVFAPITQLELLTLFTR